MLTKVEAIDYVARAVRLFGFCFLALATMAAVSDHNSIDDLLYDNGRALYYMFGIVFAARILDLEEKAENVRSLLYGFLFGAMIWTMGLVVLWQ